MGRDRVDLEFREPLGDLYLSQFKPRKAPVPRPQYVEINKAAEAAYCRSREPKTAENPANGTGGGVSQRRRRNGPNAQFNLEARPEAIAAYCALADRLR